MLDTKYDYKVMNENEAFFQLHVDLKKIMTKEIFANDANGSIGGSLGLFFGFALFDIISKLLDKFINHVSTFASNKKIFSPE